MTRLEAEQAAERMTREAKRRDKLHTGYTAQPIRGEHQDGPVQWCVMDNFDRRRG